MTHPAKFSAEIEKNGIEVKYDQPLSQYCSWKIGGKAQILAVPKTAAETAVVLQTAAQLGQKIAILAQGSNVLFSDSGLEAGVLLRELKEINRQDDKVMVQAGVPLGYLAQSLAKQGWADLAFISGVPGSVGGAVVMNAGCYGQEISSVIQKVYAADLQGQSFVFSRDECRFGYRCSRFSTGQMVVLAAELDLSERQEPQMIMERMEQYRQRRLASQPYQWPNAGSVFKNPPNDSAGRLIEGAGLKGYRIGDAQVSEKHANFIINLAQARAEDVTRLMKHIRRCVWEKYQVQLQPEVKFIGFEQDPLL